MAAFHYFLLLLLTVPTAFAARPRRVQIYASLPPLMESDAVARKQQRDFLESSSAGGVAVELHYLAHDQQRAFLESSGCGATSNNSNKAAVTAVWDALEAEKLTSLQAELYKWCALSVGDDDETTVIVWVDSQSPILSVATLQNLWETANNVAVVDDDSAVHGSYLQIRGSRRQSAGVARRMLEALLRPEIQQLLPTHALLIPRLLHATILEQQQADKQTSNNNDDWTFLQLSCRGGRELSDKYLECATGYCCSVQNDVSTILMSRHYVLPHHAIPEDTYSHRLPKPFNAAESSGAEDRLLVDGAFVSTITVKSLGSAPSSPTPNFYDILEEQNCLPADEACSKCLREKRGSDCHSCASQCHCYCQKLCHTDIPPKHVAEEWKVTLPHYSKDYPTRLIPRIVHQTWFEELGDDRERYPNMSRLVQSFQQAGWEYRFWSDEDAVEFLRVHFPPAVMQAYEAMKPGAFKADLFRYCVLLITGGVYADVDIQLESVLDISIPPDVGFMVPVDEPGKPVHKQMCTWNGLIAAAPGHPFLAKAIETVVNQVRNRFTAVDVDATFCPDPELSVLHAYDTLFTAGPCLLGATINRVLGRNGQEPHVPGELKDLWLGEQREMTIEGTSFVLVDDDDDDSLLEHRLPGRTIILHQNKWDMGAHRFTFLEQNLVVAATDLPDSNDRQHLDDEAGAAKEHYSKAHAKIGVYGVEHLYEDNEQANENIRIVVDASLHAKKQDFVKSVA